MATLRGSYPHPVLDDTDDVESTFQILNPHVIPSVEDVEVSFEIRMNDADIERMLQAGQAEYRFRWTCSSTIDNDTLGQTETTPLADSIRHRGWIDQRRIRGPVRVSVSIVASREVQDYRLAAQHSDYSGATFRLRPGDVIADAGTFEFEPDKLYDPLKPPLSSCFRFEPNDSVRKGIKVRFYDDDRVLVQFPPKLLTDFAGIANRPELQISLVVLPALMETISWIQKNLSEDGEDLDDRRWAQAILDMMDRSGGREASSLDLAQTILTHQLDRALELLTEGEDE